jgi:apolipoprotein N-acyltransferase
VTFAADPLGRITAQLAPDQPGFIDVIPANPIEPTIFDRYGNWPFLAALAAGLLLALVTRTRRPRKV